MTLPGAKEDEAARDLNQSRRLKNSKSRYFRPANKVPNLAKIFDDFSVRKPVGHPSPSQWQL